MFGDFAAVVPQRRPYPVFAMRFAVSAVSAQHLPVHHNGSSYHLQADVLALSLEKSGQSAVMMFCGTWLLLSLGALPSSATKATRSGVKPRSNVREAQQQKPIAQQGHMHIVAPKVFIISMFDGEAEAWYNIPDFDIFGQNLTVPGFSPIFSQAYCTSDGDVCQMTTGEGEINAAVSMSALWMSDYFNLTSTYFLIAGVGGVNPHIATTGSVTFPRYAVQFDLQYEFSHKQVPEDATSGYYPQAANYPDEYHPRDYPGEIYGTEAFELNDNLKKRAVRLAHKADLNDTAAAQAYRSKFPYAPANQPPNVVECDTGTSNNYWSGSILGDAFREYTKLLTNGSGLYCITQQEDNAILEALMRGTLAGKLDFDRIIIMRTASDFDRAPPDETEVWHLLHARQEGFIPSVSNLYLAGIEIVRDVVAEWEDVYKGGVKAENYVGDLWNSLRSEVEPDIGTEGIWIK